MIVLGLHVVYCPYCFVHHLMDTGPCQTDPTAGEENKVFHKHNIAQIFLSSFNFLSSELG
jgi:hypothetical protein